MRAHHIIVVIAVLAMGLGAKQLFFPPMKAEANIPSANMNVLQMQIEHKNNLLQQEMNDLTFVYPNP